MTATTGKKAEIRAAYGIDVHGLIATPGRYKHEPWYVAALDELEETDQFGDPGDGNYFSLHILTPGNTVADEIIAETGKVGFVMTLTSTGFRALEDEFDTEAEARQSFDELQREFAPEPEDGE